MRTDAVPEFGPVKFRHQRKRRVWLGDDDASGLIFYPLIFRYMSEGEQEFFESLGHPVWTQIQEGTVAPIRQAMCDFLRPIQVGTLISHSLEVRLGRRTSMKLEHSFSSDDGVVLAYGHTVRVWVQLVAGVNVELPTWLTGEAAAGE